IVAQPDTTFSNVPGDLTAPDGYVDMRDFRRFRDAYLELCAAGVGDSLCPSAGDISLDGSDTDPKKDLNFDHCTEIKAGGARRCGALEQDFSRFDFNGDGDVGVFDKAVVPLHDDGRPAANSLDGTHMTDLDVLKSQWSLNPRASEGWGPDDLLPLIRS